MAGPLKRVVLSKVVRGYLNAVQLQGVSNLPPLKLNAVLGRRTTRRPTKRAGIQKGPRHWSKNKLPLPTRTHTHTHTHTQRSHWTSGLSLEKKTAKPGGSRFEKQTRNVWQMSRLSFERDCWTRRGLSTTEGEGGSGGGGGGERKRTETERDREWQIYCYKERRTEDEVKPNRSSTASHLSRQINQSP